MPGPDGAADPKKCDDPGGHVGLEMAGVHPYVVGEFSCGSFRDRAATLKELRDLPQALVAGDAELYYLLETYRLWGTGLGWVDLHMLASAAVSGWRLLTADHALQRAAAKVGIPRG